MAGGKGQEDSGGMAFESQFCNRNENKENVLYTKIFWRKIKQTWKGQSIEIMKLRNWSRREEKVVDQWKQLQYFQISQKRRYYVGLTDDQ